MPARPPRSCPAATLGAVDRRGLLVPAQRQRWKLSGGAGSWAAARGAGRWRRKSEMPRFDARSSGHGRSYSAWRRQRHDVRILRRGQRGATGTRRPHPPARSAQGHGSTTSASSGEASAWPREHGVRLHQLGRPSCAGPREHSPSDTSEASTASTPTCRSSILLHLQLSRPLRLGPASNKKNTSGQQQPSSATYPNTLLIMIQAILLYLLVVLTRV